MEERLIDNEREIRIKRKKEGVDAVDALASDETPEEIPEEELVLEIPEGEEYDEDLVGLTPSQLKEELERREKAKKEAEEECRKLTAEGEEKLAAGEYAEAEALFLQATLYDPESVPAGKGLWRARTEDFQKDDAFYSEENAADFAKAPEEVRGSVLEKVSERLGAAREEARREAIPLREKVSQKQEERRAPFLANRKYYLVRFLAAVLAFVLAGIGAGVSASFLYTTKNSAVPIALLASFGGLAVVAFVFIAVFARKLLVAHRLCRANEKLSATEDGARLQEIETRLRILDLVLDGKPQEE